MHPNSLIIWLFLVDVEILVPFIVVNETAVLPASISKAVEIWHLTDSIGVFSMLRIFAVKREVCKKYLLHSSLFKTTYILLFVKLVIVWCPIFTLLITLVSLFNLHLHKIKDYIYIYSIFLLLFRGHRFFII